MKIYELFEDDSSGGSVNLKIVGVLSQIRGRLEDTGANGKISSDALLNRLRGVGVNISIDELMEKYSQPPFSEFIANVSGNHVVFKGQSEDTEAMDPDETTDTLEKMSDRASKKRD